MVNNDAVRVEELEKALVRAATASFSRLSDQEMAADIHAVIVSLFGPDAVAVVGSNVEVGDRVVAKGSRTPFRGIVERLVLSLDVKPERGAMRAVVADLMRIDTDSGPAQGEEKE